MTPPRTDPSAIFRQEAQELLLQLEEALLDLGQRPQDSDLIGQAFRALHTIKGSGGMFGFEAVAAFTHHLENAFDLVRSGELAVDGRLITLALAARDEIRLMIEAPGEADAARQAGILADLSRLVASPVPAAPVNVPPGPKETGWLIRFRLPPDALGMGSNPLLLLQELAGLGQVAVSPDISALPPLSQLDPEVSYLGWEVVLRTDRSRDAIEDVFLFVRDECGLSITALAGEPLRELAVSEPAFVSAAPPPEEKPAAEPLTPKVGQPVSGASMVKVSADRIDGLIDQVGELVIAQSRLKQLARTLHDPRLQAIAEEVERLSAGLRDAGMSIRMVPLASLFGRFRRVVHDLSHELGKDVQLVLSGEETELDRTVVESLGDPLVHLIRNSLDHGIEPAADRIAAGKPPMGTLSLSARHAGAQVQIVIADDGRGLSRERILAKARDKGLIPPGAEPGDEELYGLIFHPGFSTATAVTSVSGRGVGMDVVKRTIEGLRGTVEVESIPGKGSCFVLSLPLTLAIIDGLLVRLGDGHYIIPLALVEECVERAETAGGRADGNDFFDLRGDIIPFLRLHDLFSTGMVPDRYQKTVIVSANGRRVGLVVDQLLGSHQTVIKSLSPLHANLGLFSGATILGDGGIALILDVPHLVGHAQRSSKPLRMIRALS